MTWKQLHSGARLIFGAAGEDADARDMQPHDLAVMLAKVNRYGGATEEPYSVAQHSVIVSRFVEKQGGTQEAQLYALLHDAHEIATGDISTPAKEALPVAGQMALRELQLRIDRAIFERFGLPPMPLPIAIEVKRADIFALVWEARDLLQGGPRGNWTDKLADKWDVAAPTKRLRPCDWREAMRAFWVRQTALSLAIHKQARAPRLALAAPVPA